MIIPILRPLNPFRNQGCCSRIAGQRGGSTGGMVVRRQRRERTLRQRNRQLGGGIKELAEEALDLEIALGKDPNYYL